MSPDLTERLALCEAGQADRPLRAAEPSDDHVVRLWTVRPAADRVTGYDWRTSTSETGN